MGISMTQPISEKQRKFLKTQVKKRKDLAPQVQQYYQEKIDEFEHRESYSQEEIEMIENFAYQILEKRQDLKFGDFDEGVHQNIKDDEGWMPDHIPSVENIEENIWREAIDDSFQIKSNHSLEGKSLNEKFANPIDEIVETFEVTTHEVHPEIKFKTYPNPLPNIKLQTTQKENPIHQSHLQSKIVSSKTPPSSSSHTSTKNRNSSASSHALSDIILKRERLAEEQKITHQVNNQVLFMKRTLEKHESCTAKFLPEENLKEMKGLSEIGRKEDYSDTFVHEAAYGNQAEAMSNSKNFLKTPKVEENLFKETGNIFSINSFSQSPKAFTESLQINSNFPTECYGIKVGVNPNNAKIERNGSTQLESFSSGGSGVRAKNLLYF